MFSSPQVNPLPFAELDAKWTPQQSVNVPPKAADDSDASDAELMDEHLHSGGRAHVTILANSGSSSDSDSGSGSSGDDEGAAPGGIMRPTEARREAREDERVVQAMRDNSQVAREGGDHPMFENRVSRSQFFCVQLHAI